MSNTCISQLDDEVSKVEVTVEVTNHQLLWQFYGSSMKLFFWKNT